MRKKPQIYSSASCPHAIPTCYCLSKTTVCFFKVGNFVVLLETIHYLVDVGDIQLVPHCFNLICSSGPHWTRRPGSWREGTEPETESRDAHNRVSGSFSWLPCLAHSIFGAGPGAVTQDVADNLRFVARHHLVSGAASTRQQTWKHESGWFICNTDWKSGTLNFPVQDAV